MGFSLEGLWHVLSCQPHCCHLHPAPSRPLKIMYPWSHSPRAFFYILTPQDDKLFRVIHIQFNLFNACLDRFLLILENYYFSELERKARPNVCPDPQKYKRLEHKILWKNQKALLHHSQHLLEIHGHVCSHFEVTGEGNANEEVRLWDQIRNMCTLHQCFYFVSTDTNTK